MIIIIPPPPPPIMYGLHSSMFSVLIFVIIFISTLIILKLIDRWLSRDVRKYHKMINEKVKNFNNN
jgi:hypothetical protein